MERQALYERFKTLTWQQQLGNLASTLATISKQATQPQQDELTNLLLREAALMIEWCVANVPSKCHWELAALQRECLHWKRVFPLEKARELLTLQSLNYSERVLRMAGLSGDEKHLFSSGQLELVDI